MIDICQKYSEGSREQSLHVSVSCTFACYHVIISQTVHAENNACMLCASVSCWARLFTARCSLVQSAVLRSHVVCPSVCPSVTLVNC